MRPFFIVLSVVGVTGTACSDADTQWVPFPPVDADRAAVVALVSDGALTVHALDLDDDAMVEATVDRASGRLEWLAYAESLDALDLDAGLLRPARAEVMTRFLPRPRATFHAMVDGEAVSPWRAEMTSAVLENFEIEADDPCGAFDIESLPIEPRDFIRFAFRASDDSVVFTSHPGKAFLYDRDGAREITMTPTVTVSGGFVDDAGGIHIVGYRGNVYTARYENETLIVESVGQTPLSHQLRWIDGGTVNNKTELFVVGYNGGVQYFDGNAWSVVYETSGVSAKGGVVWLGPGEALFGTGIGTSIFHMHDGRIDLIASGADGVTMLLESSRGIHVARGQGSLQRRNDDGVFESLGETSIHLDIYVLEPTLTGFFYAGADGFFGEYVDGFGYCPSIQVSNGAIRHIIPVGDKFLLLGDRNDLDDRATAMTIQRR